jgi:hypothetical protein
MAAADGWPFALFGVEADAGSAHATAATATAMTAAKRANLGALCMVPPLES